MSMFVNYDNASLSDIDQSIQDIQAAIESSVSNDGDAPAPAAVSGAPEADLSQPAAAAPAMPSQQPQPQPSAFVKPVAAKAGANPARKQSADMMGGARARPSLFAASGADIMGGARAAGINAMGLPMSYDEKREAARKAALARPAQARGANGASRLDAAGRLYGDVQIAGMSVGQDSVSPRGVKMSRETAIKLGRVPQQMLDSLGRAQNARAKPTEANILRMLQQGDARAMTMIGSLDGAEQQDIREKMHMQPAGGKPAEGAKAPASKSPTMH